MVQWSRFGIGAGFVTGILIVFGGQLAQVVAQQVIRVRVDRWLEVRELKGSVTKYHSGVASPASPGSRLTSVGDGISTGSQSSAQLSVDTNIGLVNVSENTAFYIQSLQFAPDNGRITRLQVTKGQVRLQVRPFNHRGSQLEIQTPSSISGVRGTEFGITVQPNGKTGLATAKGAVTSAARGQSQLVQAGFQNFTLPGEAPSPPVPLRNDTSLSYEFEPLFQGGVARLRLKGQVDPVNSVLVEGEPQVTDREGKFSILLYVPSEPRYRVVVITPLGKKQQYEVAYQ